MSSRGSNATMPARIPAVTAAVAIATRKAIASKRGVVP
jgi:hypothetical protein